MLIDRRQGPRRDPVALRAEHERQPVRRVGGQHVEGHRLRRQRERCHVEPGGRSRSRSSGQLASRVHGTWKTVPIDTRTLRR